jgi:predicted nucleotidyltransferase component of viral defense system
MKRRKPLTNIAASVRQRLYNLAHELGEDFNLILSRYAVERLLYRLSQSPFANEFVLSGVSIASRFPRSSHQGLST